MDHIEPGAPPQVIHTRTVTVVAPSGNISAFLARPDGAAWKSAAVVVGESGRIDESTGEACRALARAGHGALAVDLSSFELFDTGEEHAGRGFAATSSVTVTRLADAASATLAFLRTQAPSPPPRLGVVGYGVGGFVALVAGYRCQIGAAISVYGEGPMRLRENLTEIIDRPKRHAASLLCLLGGEDLAVRPDDLGAIRERLDAFGMRHTFIIYPRTKGRFCHPASLEYRANEAGDAWRRVLHALETAPRLRHRFRQKEPGSVPT